MHLSTKSHSMFKLGKRFLVVISGTVLSTVLVIALSRGGISTLAASAQNPVLQLVTPPSKKAIVKECVADIVGKINDPSVKSVELYKVITVVRTFSLQTIEYRRNFSPDMATFWKDDMVGSSLHLTAKTFQGDSSTADFSWDLGASPTLQTLWATDAGKQIAKIVNDPAMASVRISVNGWTRADAIISGAGSDRWFNSSMQLGVGDNVIALSAHDQKGAVTAVDTVRIFYLVDNFADAAGAGYQKYVFHGSDVEPSCRTCHKLKSFASRDACTPCHDGLSNQRFTHMPTKRKQCMACHDSTSPTYKLQKALGSDAELCYTCHKRQRAEWGADSMKRHAPVDGGECLQCHSPHSTQNIFHTVMPINSMCKACHEKKDEFLHPVVGHPHANRPEGQLRPGRELSCAGCHDPHAARFDKMLRYGNGMDGCVACHPK